MRLFRNCLELADVLARQLAKYAGVSDVVVLALPRGGVPVASEVARASGAPLDVFTVRKIGPPVERGIRDRAIAQRRGGRA